MDVTIHRKHTVNTRFHSQRDDALARAVKEQHPGFNLKTVHDDFLYDQKLNRYDFNATDKLGYNQDSFIALQRGDIKEIKLTLKRASLGGRG